MAATAASHYSRYDDGLDTDEEEEERRLSEQHGEAADDDRGAPKRKRGSNSAQQNTKLTEEDAAAAKEFEDKLRKKKSRPALTAAELKGEKGLIFVRRSFPTQIRKYRDVPFANKVRGTGARSNRLAQKLNTSGQINAAAQYSRSLMGAYREFAHELFPSLAVEDVFLKIEDLGSKKEVKDYLQLMRNELRKEHMAGIYGEVKANRILNELEYGLSVHPIQDKMDGQLGREGAGNVMPRMGRAAESDDEVGEIGDETDTPTASPPKRMAAANPYASKKVNEAVAATLRGGSPEKEGAEEDVGADSNDTPPATAEKSATPGDEDEEDEAEATFSVSGDDNVAEDGTALAPTEDSDGSASAIEKGTDEADIVSEETTQQMDNELAANGDDNTESTGTDAKNLVAEKHNDSTDDADEDKDAAPPCSDMPENAEKEDPPSKLAVTEGIDEESTNKDDGGENDETLTQAVSVEKTQETLTLMESQMEDVEMEYTQDDGRFSQVSVVGGSAEEEKRPADVDTPTQVVGTQDDDGAFTQDDEHFSQSQDDRFSQASIARGSLKENEDEENTERFSQFTPGKEPVFEETEGDEDQTGNGNSSQLGQTMDTQLSLEY